MLFQYNEFTTLCIGTRFERENSFDMLSNEEYSKNKTNFVSKALLAVVSTSKLNLNEYEYRSVVAEK